MNKKTKKIIFSDIEHFYLIGGGLNMLFFAKKLKKKFKAKVFILTTFSHATELYKNTTYEQLIKESKIDFKVAKNENNFLKSLKIENAIAFCFGPKNIFLKSVVKKFNFGIYNINPIPIPFYLGGAHFSWQILNSNYDAGIFLQQISNKLDRGPILLFKKFKVRKSVHFPIDYFKEYEPKIKEFLLQIIQNLKKKNKFDVKMHDEIYSKSIYFPRLNSNINGFINWDWGIKDIVKFINAFSYPYPGAKGFCKKKIFLIKEASIYNKKKYHPFCSGIVLRKNKNFFVALKDGTLLIKKIYNERNQDISKFIKQGDRFYTPQKILEKALIYRQKP